MIAFAHSPPPRRRTCFATGHRMHPWRGGRPVKGRMVYALRTRWFWMTHEQLLRTAQGE